ncbi:MAG: VanW family protein [Firmicutes bacterium]|nr:VanW family protein [Bacillota bacterium]
MSRIIDNLKRRLRRRRQRFSGRQIFAHKYFVGAFVVFFIIAMIFSGVKNETASASVGAFTSGEYFSDSHITENSLTTQSYFSDNKTAKPKKESASKNKNVIKVDKEKFRDVNIALRYDGQIYKFDYKVPTTIPNIHTLSEILQTQSGYKNKQKRIENLVENGLCYKQAFLQVYEGFEKFLAEVESKVNQKPRNASVIFCAKNGANFTFKDEVIGRELCRDSLFKALEQGLKAQTSVEVRLSTNDTSPKVSVADLQQNTQKRVAFSTNFATSSSGRRHNIALALSRFNGATVRAGESISFNKTVGNRTGERGYKEAKIIVDGKFKQGVGGGVCQVSTTLYNAWLLADLQIASYRAHSLPISYVPLSFDATVSRHTDLVLKNNTQSDVFLRTYVSGTNAYVEIYGSPMREGLEIKRRTEVIEHIKGDDEIIRDVDGEHLNRVKYKGEFARINHSKPGVKSKGYLDYYINGARVESRLLRTDSYKAQKGLVIEGAKDREIEPDLNEQLEYGYETEQGITNKFRRMF